MVDYKFDKLDTISETHYMGKNPNSIGLKVNQGHFNLEFGESRDFSNAESCIESTITS